MLRILCFLFLVSGALRGQSDYQTAVDRFVQAPEFVHASVGVAIIDPDGNRLLAHHAANRSLLPASNLKVVTTATALQLLGPEHRFETQLQLDGRVSTDGTLEGNLILVGGGDPVLGSDRLKTADNLETLLARLTEAVRGRGIRRITGAVVGDDRYFGAAAVPHQWQWNDLGNYYAAGANGLNIHENLYYLDFQRGARTGSPTQVVGTRPNVPLQFRNEVTSAGPRSGDNAYIFGAPYTYTRTVRGTIPSGSGTFTVKGSLPDPPLFAAQLLTDHLRAAGIEVVASPSTSRYLELPAAFGETIYVHQSPPLREIVERANLRSVNLYCEVLLLHIGRALNAGPDRADAVRALQTYWTERGVDAEGWWQLDGSGLARANGITVRQIALILAKATKDARTFPDFETSLPLAGSTGSLRRRMTGTTTRGRVRGKTGTLSRVRAYSGYFYPSPDRPIAYSIMLNNYTGSGGAARRRMEELLSALLR